MNLLDDKDEFHKSGLDLQEINRCIDHLEYAVPHMEPDKARVSKKMLKALKELRKVQFGIE